MKKLDKIRLSLAQKTASKPLNRIETAGYIADMSLQMRTMAEKSDLPFLAHLLEIVVLQAMQVSKDGVDHPGRQGRSKKKPS